MFYKTFSEFFRPESQTWDLAPKQKLVYKKKNKKKQAS